MERFHEIASVSNFSLRHLYTYEKKVEYDFINSDRQWYNTDIIHTTKQPKGRIHMYTTSLLH